MRLNTLNKGTATFELGFESFEEIGSKSFGVQLSILRTSDTTRNFFDARFEPVRLFNNNVTYELEEAINNHAKYKPREIENLIAKSNFDINDFNFLIETLVTSKDSMSQDLAVGVLTNFPVDFFSDIVSLLRNKDHDFYGSLNLIEALVGWNSIDRNEKIKALKGLLEDEFYSPIWQSINEHISAIS